MTENRDRHLGRKLRILNPKALDLPSYEKNNCYEILTAGYSAFRIDRPTGDATYFVVSFEQVDAGHAQYVGDPKHGKHNIGRKIRILNPDKMGIRCEGRAVFEVTGMTEDMYQLPKGTFDLMRDVPWHVKPVWFESGYVEWVEEKEEEKPEHGPHNVGRTIISKIKGTWVVKSWDGTRYLAGNGIVATPTHFIDGDVRWAEGEEKVTGKLEVPEHGEHNVGRTMVMASNGDRFVAASWDGSFYRSDTDRALASPGNFEHGQAYWERNYWERKAEEFKKPKPEHGEHNVDRILVDSSGNRRRVNGWNPTRVHPAYYDTRDDKGYARANIKAADIGGCGIWQWLEDAPASWTEPHGEHNVGRTARFRDGSGSFRVIAWDEAARYYIAEDDRVTDDDPDLEVSASLFDDGIALWGDPVAKPLKDITKTELSAAYAKLKEREKGTGPGWYWGRMNDDDEWQPVKTMTGDFGECWTIGAKLPSINEDGQYDLS